jgi:gluconokinase
VIVILIGVSGSGKTTLGQSLAKAIAAPFYDGDNYHSPAAKEKMKRGIALTDEDRFPWLERLALEMKKWNQEKPVTLLACSALKQKYRDLLSQEIPVQWIYLKGSEKLIRQRLEARQGHFMNSKLLESQFADLEEPSDAITVDIAQEAAKIAEILVPHLKRSEGS